MSDEKKKEIDKISGVETTGHEWDGLKELNNPAPRWWIWVWIACTVWAVGYWVFYPTWPTISGHTKGVLGWTQYNQLEAAQDKITARQNVYLERFESASLDEVMADPELYAFAIAGGNSAFKDNCATCHGTGGAGSKGYPNLNDDAWIWGGSLDEIYQTISYGIRSDHDDTRISQMPAFGADEILEKEEISSVVDYVLSLSGGEKATSYAQGQEVFIDNCAACHGADAKGIRELGAPNLSDAIWLYGGEREDIYETVFSSRAGVMPSWTERLDKNTIRQLSIYVHELGGGE